ncbi:MAG TPA: gamma-glutamylcyclotransferase family protein [Pseudolabrys sp.]|nr:gamma-glutamylcyclotransferase family protein [Pseudolabrys sp.]
MTDRITIFAYGSNMRSNRLLARTPSAVPLGPGQLRGHRLEWHKTGSDGSGKCDVVHTGRDEDVVWGVVYTIDAAEKPDLDAAEALGIGYSEKCAAIICGERTHNAWLYVAIDVSRDLTPYHWYKAFVVEGAREHGLPPDYVATLEAIASAPDDDEARAAMNAAILAGS